MRVIVLAVFGTTISPNLFFMVLNAPNPQVMGALVIGTSLRVMG